MPLQICIRCLTSLTLVFLKIHMVGFESRYLTNLMPPLTTAILMVCTVRPDGQNEAPTPWVNSDDMSFEEAERYINEIAKVIQLAISPSGSDHATVLGPRAWECKVKGEDHH